MDEDANGLSAPIPSLRDEEGARAKIRKNRIVATALLAGMIVVFALSWLLPDGSFATGLVRAGSEAGIVGGMADWFAVTALFRHPLGIPIPHTAILPNNKDRIGRALASFIERSFLTEAVMIPRLRAANPAQRIAGWLSSPQAVAYAIGPLMGLLPRLGVALQRPELRDLLANSVGEELRKIRPADALAKILEVLTQGEEADVLFGTLVKGGLHWLEANKVEIGRLVEQRSRWWIPAVVNRQIARALHDGLVEVMTKLQAGDSPEREKLRDALRAMISDMTASPESDAKLRSLRDKLLGGPQVRAWLNAIWSDLSGALFTDATKPDSRIRAAIEKNLVSAGQALAADPALQSWVEQIVEAATGQVASFRGEIARFVADVIRSWDAETLSSRLELVIGSDLQYIRMNGTLVGGLVGCVLYACTYPLS